MAAVLVVEDDNDLSDLVAHHLRREGYDVTSVNDGARAVELTRADPPALIILDLMLPGLPGLEVCRRIRSQPQTAGVPIIMVTARSSEADRVVGLELGADDYVTKPFSPRELVARVRAVLRRGLREEVPARRERLDFGELQIDLDAYRVTLRGETVALTPTQLKMLFLMASHPERAFTREQIIQQACGGDIFIEARTVDSHVSRIRSQLGEAPGGGWYVETVRGVGYRFRAKRP
jgi:two-component system, OmpR family, alkaline phosphatase synthesis response regulator PhoP